MPKRNQFAIVITHVGALKDLLTMDWLENDYRVDESDWIVLSHDDWRAFARGEPSICQALERRLLIGHYASEPELVAVVGHPLSGNPRERADVARIVRRVRSLRLPATVMGFWTDEDGWLMDVVDQSERVSAELVGC